MLLQNIKLNLAYIEKDNGKYKEIYQNADPAIKKSKAIIAQKKCVENQYGQAIEVLQDIFPKCRYEEVMKYNRMAECYLNQEKFTEATECLNFVIEYGNTLGVRQKAIQILEDL